jgi:hypothetical protein
VFATWRPALGVALRPGAANRAQLRG